MVFFCFHQKLLNATKNIQGNFGMATKGTKKSTQCVLNFLNLFYSNTKSLVYR